MTSPASENITPSNLHARRAPMVGSPLGMHRIPPIYSRPNLLRQKAPPCVKETPK